MFVRITALSTEVQLFSQSNRKDSLSARKTRILRTVGISYRIKKIPCESVKYDCGNLFPFHNCL